MPDSTQEYVNLEKFFPANHIAKYWRN